MNDLEQVDYPEDEEFDNGVGIDEMILESLNWFASFQISLLTKRKKRDAIDRTFIDKLKREMIQSKYVV